MERRKKMNKYQESLSYIIDKYIDMHYEGKPMNEDTKHALRLRELVERATPKKPIATKHTRRCPVCNRQISGINNVHPNRKFCPNCGQALDWR